MFESADWSHRGVYIVNRHGVTPRQANEALSDPERVVIDPDYNSISGRSARVIGFVPELGDLVSVLVVVDGGVVHGVNAWRSNDRDRRIYREGEA